MSKKLQSILLDMANRAEGMRCFRKASRLMLAVSESMQGDHDAGVIFRDGLRLYTAYQAGLSNPFEYC